MLKTDEQIKFQSIRVMGTGTLVHSLGSMNLSPMIPEWFVLPILWKTHGTGVNHRVFCKESL